jgi:hypothetical protein
MTWVDDNGGRGMLHPELGAEAYKASSPDHIRERHHTE